MYDQKAVWIGLMVGLALLVVGQPPGRYVKTWAPVPKTLLPDFDVYLINLESAYARLNHFMSEIKKSDMARQSFIRFPAVNGAVLDLGALLTPTALREIEYAEHTGFRLRHYQLSRGAVGCYMSHVSAWQSILRADKEVALIFEDDAQLHPRILEYLKTTEFPEEFDVLLLGYVPIQVTRDEAAGVHRVRRFFGLHGYCISKKGIRKLLASPRLFPIRKQIDSVLSDMAHAGELTVFATPRRWVEQANETFRTQIQLPIKPGENPWGQTS